MGGDLVENAMQLEGVLLIKDFYQESFGLTVRRDMNTQRKTLT